MPKYTKTAKLEKLISKTISVQEFAKKHGKSVLTIHNWRDEGLPSISIPGSARPAIRLVTKEADDWVKRRDKSAKADAGSKNKRKAFKAVRQKALRAA